MHSVGDPHSPLPSLLPQGGQRSGKLQHIKVVAGGWCSLTLVGGEGVPREVCKMVKIAGRFRDWCVAKKRRQPSCGLVSFPD